MESGALALVDERGCFPAHNVKKAHPIDTRPWRAEQEGAKNAVRSSRWSDAYRF